MSSSPRLILPLLTVPPLARWRERDFRSSDGSGISIAIDFTTSDHKILVSRFLSVF